MKNNKENLKTRFLGLREKLGLTQQEAGRLFSVSLQTWQNWEYGLHFPNFATIKLLEHYELHPPAKHQIPEMCKAVRENLGLTKEGIATLFEVTTRSWADWERGAMKPSNKYLEKIEKMFAELKEKGELQKVS